ncbi:PREDICTED: probable G-protein coupled receptor 88 [Calidris pugnax]|uniref:probable G-protein coupled receptor 88 n=1 Tax=Calidris pugnax TaxID=198806 RepID=UPI00071E4794|nr:PREDICTED: probable G-protein coupled receptor 88 [Calidris pugnax]
MPNASSWSASSPLLLLWEDSSGTRIFLSLLYAVLAISGTLSNVMVIYLVFSFKKLQTTSNAFIVNGCAADLSVCALWMPQEAVLGLLPPNSSSLRSAEYRLLRGGLLGLGLTVSLASHLLVAFNRYVLITKLPSVYQALYQRRHTGCMIGLSWALALLLVPLLPGLWTPGSGQQPPPRPTDGSSRYTALLLALAVLGQTALLLHCYLGIVRRVRGSAKRVSVLNFHLLHQLPFPAAPPPPRRAQRRLSSVSVLLLCCVFLLGTQPLVWVSLLGFFLRPAPPALQAASWLLLCSLSALNPLLYTWRSEEFRRAARSVLPRGEGPAAAPQPWRLLRGSGTGAGLGVSRPPAARPCPPPQRRSPRRQPPAPGGRPGLQPDPEIWDNRNTKEERNILTRQNQLLWFKDQDKRNKDRAAIIEKLYLGPKTPCVRGQPYKVKELQVKNGIVKPYRGTPGLLAVPPKVSLGAEAGDLYCPEADPGTRAKTPGIHMFTRLQVVGDSKVSRLKKEVIPQVRGHNILCKEGNYLKPCMMNLACYVQSSSSAEAPTVDYHFKLDSGPTVNAADVADDLFLRQILPEYVIVLHFWPENDGSLSPGGQLCQDNKSMFFLLCPGGSVEEGRWSSFQRIFAFAIVIEKADE